MACLVQCGAGGNVKNVQNQAQVKNTRPKKVLVLERLPLQRPQLAVHGDPGHEPSVLRVDPPDRLADPVKLNLLKT